MTIAQIKLLMNNRQPHEDYAPRIRWSTLDAAVAEFTAMVDRICTCGHQDRGFDIPVRRSSGVEAMEAARIDRLREVDERVEAELFEAAL